MNGSVCELVWPGSGWVAEEAAVVELVPDDALAVELTLLGGADERVLELPEVDELVVVVELWEPAEEPRE